MKRLPPVVACLGLLSFGPSGLSAQDASQAPDVGHALLALVISDPRTDESCAVLVRVRKLPPQGPVPGWVVAMPPEVDVCFTDATELDWLAGFGSEPPGRVPSLADVRKGTVLDVLPRGVSLPTNPPRLIAVRALLQLQPRASR